MSFSLRITIAVLSVLALSYSGVCIYYYFAQERFLFYPTQELAAFPSDLTISEIEFQNGDGDRLYGWWMELERATNTVLFFHGNAGNLSDRIFRLKIFASLGYNCLIFDYRGYGKSEGNIKREDDLYQDAQAAYAYLQNEQGIEDENIILWAKSIGTGIGVDLAVGKDVRALVLESPYTSIIDMTRYYLPILPARLLVRYPLDSYSKIRNINAPLLIFHSENDEVIPFQFGQKLYEHANEPKHFVTLSGGHNNDILKSEGSYLSEISIFEKNFLK